MGRPPRVTQPGLAYHILNRRVMRLPLFAKDHDYLAFERVLAESLERPDAPHLLAWCLMPNHWHLVVHARTQTNLSTWMQWVTVTHTHRWHAHTQTAGEGPLYQGRFKSFPVQEDGHFLTVCRYAEANPRRANLVERAERWQWSSLWARRRRTSALKRCLQPWPVDRPRNWLAEVNQEMDEEALQSVRQSVTKGAPLGSETWTSRIAMRLGLDTPSDHASGHARTREIHPDTFSDLIPTTFSDRSMSGTGNRVSSDNALSSAVEAVTRRPAPRGIPARRS